MPEPTLEERIAQLVEQELNPTPDAAPARGPALNDVREFGGNWYIYTGNPDSPWELYVAGPQPAGRAPTQPDTYTDRNGDLVGVDPYTGVELYRIPGAGVPRLDPYQQAAIDAQQLQQQQQFTAGENRLDRLFRAGESALDRTYQSGEAEQARAYQGGESALDRAQAASRFAAQFGLEQEQARQSNALARFDRSTALNQARLGAAGQFANLVSSVDPAALPAFYEAGGGNIMNALAGGATALSENALRPGALTLDTIDALGAQQAALAAMPQWTMTSYNPFAYQPSAFAAPRPEPRPAPIAPPSSGGISPLTGSLANAPSAANFGMDSGGNLVYTGGVVAAADGFDGTVTRPTLLLTGEEGPEHVSVTPANMARVRALRERVDTREPLGLGSMNTRFGFLPPSLVQRYFAARQSRFGIPLADQMAEAARYALPGVQRRFAFGR